LNHKENSVSLADRFKPAILSIQGLVQLFLILNKHFRLLIKLLRVAKRKDCQHCLLYLYKDFIIIAILVYEATALDAFLVWPLSHNIHQVTASIEIFLRRRELYDMRAHFAVNEFISLKRELH